MNLSKAEIPRHHRHWMLVICAAPSRCGAKETNQLWGHCRTMADRNRQFLCICDQIRCGTCVCWWSSCSASSIPSLWELEQPIGARMQNGTDPRYPNWYRTRMWVMMHAEFACRYTNHSFHTWVPPRGFILALVISTWCSSSKPK